MQKLVLENTARHGGKHALAVQHQVEELVTPFLSNMKKVSSLNQAMPVQSFRSEGFSQSLAEQVTGAHPAAFFGLSCLLQELTYSDKMVRLFI